MPKISYEDFCKEHINTDTDTIAVNSEISYFKMAMCNKIGDVKMSEKEMNTKISVVEYVLYIFNFGLKMLFAFLGTITLRYFMKNKELYISIVLYATAGYLFVVSLAVYLSVVM